MRISDWSSDVCSSDLQLGPLLLGIPAVTCGAEGEDALLRPALLLVAPRAAEADIEAVEVERLLQSLGLPPVGVTGAMVERVGAECLRIGLLIEHPVHPSLRGLPLPQVVPRPELSFPVQ